MFEGTTAQLAWSALILFLLLGLLVVILQKYRSRNDDDLPTASDLLTWSRNTYSRGGLSEEEYRTIKKKLGNKLRHDSEQAKDGDQTD